MSEKIIGYIFLVLGVFIVLYSGINVYQVYTRKIPAISLFHFEPVFIEMPVEGSSEGVKIEILSERELNETSNIIAHTILMGFIGGVGYKISKIGVYLLRPIVVKLKEREEVDGEEKKA